ncbi:transporter substrate-binding domain-containing protein [Sinorhizobium sp. BG8]|uniref:substrate-binding periplasmic protein n=1 Tax=Sinorhizobium sp. BG8 TaxID=2613773 RepID=UPI00193E28B9|nr:transporter substrate-binding domain-containing protein [Sinorhizobium sp. BG8]QRM56281.1 amino acid ABC transporter substrate-binding protein [Sinorhizobium sp. BG8]
MKTLILGLAVAFAQPVHAAEIKFVTEEYAPFNYSEGGALKGIAVDQVHTIAKRAGLDYSIEIMPWARAFALAQTQPDHCVFTTGHSKDRDASFLWVEPLLKDEMVMVKRKDSPVAASTVEEARKLRVGSQRGDFAVDILTEHGFRDIDLAANIEITLGKLVSGRIDLMPTSIKTFQMMVKDGKPVEKAMLMDGQIYGIACNRSTPPEVVTKLQAALDDLIVEGTQDRIFASYGLPPNTRTAANEE